MEQLVKNPLNIREAQQAKAQIGKTMNGRLKMLRERKGMTQVEFAHHLGVTQSNVSLLEKSHHVDPSAKFLRKLAEKFPQLSMDWFIRGSGPMMKTDHRLTEDELKREVESLREELHDLRIDKITYQKLLVRDSSPLQLNDEDV